MNTHYNTPHNNVSDRTAGTFNESTETSNTCAESLSYHFILTSKLAPLGLPPDIGKKIDYLYLKLQRNTNTASNDADIPRRQRPDRLSKTLTASPRQSAPKPPRRPRAVSRAKRKPKQATMAPLVTHPPVPVVRRAVSVPRPRRPKKNPVDSLPLGGAEVDGIEAVRFYDRPTTSPPPPPPRTTPSRIVKPLVIAPVFALEGPYPDLRLELLERGWEEVQPAELTKGLLFAVKSANVKDHPPEVMVNHFPGAAALTTKTGISKHLRAMAYWADVDHRSVFPPCFDVSPGPDSIAFRDYYRIMGAVNLLVRGGVTNKVRGLANRALRHKRFIMDHSDIDGVPRAARPLTVQQWAEIEAAVSVRPLSDLPAVPPPLQAESDELLTFWRGVDPIVRDSRGHNLWVVKPAGKSRGRGIVIHQDIDAILSLATLSAHVAQKYIERPLLINGLKFDIRQWVLVTSWDPVVVWFYGECYGRLCSEPFDLDNKDPAVHLSNNSIQKHCKAFNQVQGLDADNNIVSTELLAKTIGKDEFAAVQQSMSRTAVQCALSVQDVVEHADNRFELFGYDFLVDDALNTWVIEVNCSPTMEHSSDVTSRMVPDALKGMVGVLIDADRGFTAPIGQDGWASVGEVTAGLGAPESVGKWNLVYRGPRVGGSLAQHADLTCTGRKFDER